MQDVASEHHISPQLVGRLVKGFRADITMITSKRQKEEMESHIEKSMDQVVTHLLSNHRKIWNSGVV